MKPARTKPKLALLPTMSIVQQTSRRQTVFPFLFLTWPALLPRLRFHQSQIRQTPGNVSSAKIHGNRRKTGKAETETGLDVV